MKKILIANWKMCNKTAKEAFCFLKTLRNAHEKDVRIAPPFTLIREMAGNSNGIRIGGQNMHTYAEGAFTGEISAFMLKEAGADFVILGHSERRHLLGENLEFIQGKVERALVEGLELILCVGETLEERQEGKTMEVLDYQLESALQDLSEEEIKKFVTVAYEPVWAIGTGKRADSKEIAEVHQWIKEKYPVSVMYGGSVNLENFSSLILEPFIDGVLVGGASLSSNIFDQMIEQLPKG